MDKRISMITAIFSDHNQAKMVERLYGNDAQIFIDTIDGVSLVPPPTNEPADFHSNFHVFSVRYWIVFHHISTEGVCALYTGFVVAKPCFRNHW